MAKKIVLTRGKIVTDKENNLYIFIKKNKSNSHVVLVDLYGYPIELKMIPTKDIIDVTVFPETFKSIDITL